MTYTVQAKILEVADAASKNVIECFFLFNCNLSHGRILFGDVSIDVVSYSRQFVHLSSLYEKKLKVLFLTWGVKIRLDLQRYNDLLVSSHHYCVLVKQKIMLDDFLQGHVVWIALWPNSLWHTIKQQLVIWNAQVVNFNSTFEARIQ